MRRRKAIQERRVGAFLEMRIVTKRVVLYDGLHRSPGGLIDYIPSTQTLRLSEIST